MARIYKSNDNCADKRTWTVNPLAHLKNRIKLNKSGNFDWRHEQAETVKTLELASRYIDCDSRQTMGLDLK